MIGELPKKTKYRATRKVGPEWRGPSSDDAVDC